MIEIVLLIEIVLVFWSSKSLKKSKKLIRTPREIHRHVRERSFDFSARSSHMKLLSRLKSRGSKYRIVYETREFKDAVNQPRSRVVASRVALSGTREYANCAKVAQRDSIRAFYSAARIVSRAVGSARARNISLHAIDDSLSLSLPPSVENSERATFQFRDKRSSFRGSRFRGFGVSIINERASPSYPPPLSLSLLIPAGIKPEFLTRFPLQKAPSRRARPQVQKRLSDDSAARSRARAPSLGIKIEIWAPALSGVKSSHLLCVRRAV